MHFPGLRSSRPGRLQVCRPEKVWFSNVAISGIYAATAFQYLEKHFGRIAPGLGGGQKVAILFHSAHFEYFSCREEYRSSQNYYWQSCYSWEFVSRKLPLLLPSWNSDELPLPLPSWPPQSPLHFHWLPITVLKVIWINFPKITITVTVLKCFWIRKVIISNMTVKHGNKIAWKSWDDSGIFLMYSAVRCFFPSPNYFGIRKRYTDRYYYPTYYLFCGYGQIQIGNSFRIILHSVLVLLGM